LHEPNKYIIHMRSNLEASILGALDYWSIRYILLQNWENRSGEISVSMDLDNTDSGFFGNWIQLSMNELQKGGFSVNIGESFMDVYMAENAVNQ